MIEREPNITSVTTSVDGVNVLINKVVEFEFSKRSSYLKVFIPANEFNACHKLIHDALVISKEEATDLIGFAKKYYEENYETIVGDLVDSKSKIPL